MPKNSKSFFERLTGNIGRSEDADDDDDTDIETESDEKEERKIEIGKGDDKLKGKEKEGWAAEEDMGQLTVDMYQTPSEIVIKAMVAGAKPENLDVSISQDMLTIKGHREESKETEEDGYYYKELYWGGFGRSILLPQEVDQENIEANIKDGLLTLRLPKVNREKTQKIKIKNG